MYQILLRVYLDNFNLPGSLVADILVGLLLDHVHAQTQCYERQQLNELLGTY